MFPLRLMIQGEDTRRALYTYMMHSDQHFDLLEQDLRALQEGLRGQARKRVHCEHQWQAGLQLPFRFASRRLVR